MGTHVHAGEHRATQGYTGVHRGTQTHRDTQGYTGVQGGAQHTWGHTGSRRGTRGYIGAHRDKQGYSGVHRGTQGYTAHTGAHMGSEGDKDILIGTRRHTMAYMDTQAHMVVQDTNGHTWVHRTRTDRNTHLPIGAHRGARRLPHS